MKPKVYLETTIVSYLTAWPSRDVIVLGNQQVTRDWWSEHRDEFELFVSEIVIQEAQAGDPKAADERLDALKDIASLQVTLDVYTLADELLKQVPLPAKARADSLHIAVAALNGMDYLLTWNCAHIANATLRHRIEAVCRDLGYDCPVICTPQELLEN